MDTSPIPGYITRKQAAEQSGRAERTLQRYWSKAIERNDRKVLSHLKLRTEDGEMVNGTAVTKDRIDALRGEGKNPTWYAEAEWTLATYGSSSDDADEHSVKSDQVTPEQDGLAGSDPDLFESLRSEIDELRRDKDRLYAELNIKNEQIKEANSRTRESNTLMQELQKMLGDWQNQAFRSLPAPTSPSIVESPETPTVIHAPPPPERRKAPKQRPATGPSRAAPARKPKWNEFPTLKRLFSRSP